MNLCISFLPNVRFKCMIFLPTLNTIVLCNFKPFHNNLSRKTPVDINPMVGYLYDGSNPIITYESFEKWILHPILCDDLIQTIPNNKLVFSGLNLYKTNINGHDFVISRVINITYDSCPRFHHLNIIKHVKTISEVTLKCIHHTKSSPLSCPSTSILKK